MIQNFSELKFQVEKFNELLSSYDREIESFPIQKIFSDAKFISFSVRFPGRTVYIYTGRGNNYEGLWLSSKNIPSEYRIRDRYLEYLRKYLVGARIGIIESDTDDRIIYITYYKQKNKGMFAIFYSGRNMYFINIFKDLKGDYKLFLSWEHIRDNTVSVSDFDEMKETCIKYFSQVGRKNIAIDTHGPLKASSELQLDEYYLSKKSQLTYAPSSKRKRKFYQKKEVRILTDLKKVKKWRDLKDLIESELFELPESLEFKILDIKFKIDSSWSKPKRINEIYNKIKKLKKAEGILNERLIQTKKECKNWIEGKESKVLTSEKVIVPIWYGVKDVKKSAQAQSCIKYNYKTFETKDNIKVFVGKDSEANDYIRSKLAHKDDMWFHLDGIKSAHLIAKIKSFSDISTEHFILFASILRDFTHLSSLDLGLVYTNVKNIKGVKGRKGSVTIKKQKYLVIQYDKNWKETISEV